jgi:hypothetical protein
VEVGVTETGFDKAGEDDFGMLRILWFQLMFWTENYE